MALRCRAIRLPRPTSLIHRYRAVTFHGLPLFGLAVALIAIAANLAAELWSVNDTPLHLVALASLAAICIATAGVIVREAKRRQIIEHHDAADRLHVQKEAAESANFAKSRYLASVSHEIRSPLNAIYGYAQLMERGGQIDTLEAAKVIRRSAEHLTSLVDGLLDISQLENGVMHIKQDTVRFVEFLNQIFWMMRPSAQTRGLEFRADYPAWLPDYVRVDQSRLRQVLINLLANAIKFTERGSVTFKVRYSGQIARFEVIDTGAGIREEDRDRIFEPFERGGHVGPQTQPGVGLGLSISQAIVQILGGELTFQSTPGAGSRFAVTLMLSQVAGRVGDFAPARSVVGYEGPRRSILLVDDDIQQLSFVRSLLESLGFDVAAVPNGETAVALGAARQFDLALLDITLPGMSGWEVATYLRERAGPQLAIVMLSANVQEFHRPETAVIVHDLFLVKPIEFNTLLDALGGLLKLMWREEARRDGPAPDVEVTEQAEGPGLSAEAMVHVERLRNLLRIGHVRAVEAEIAALDDAAPHARDLIARLYTCLDRYDLAAMMRMLEDV
jgi:signal transduction histidine kinase/ActR/RegA family two-component response regulator